MKAPALPYPVGTVVEDEIFQYRYGRPPYAEYGEAVYMGPVQTGPRTWRHEYRSLRTSGSAPTFQTRHPLEAVGRDAEAAA